jgi:hypothetical protein
MTRFDPPFVKVGQVVTTAIFHAMMRAVRAVTLIAGPGVRLRVTPAGTMISFDAGNQSFVHPWQASLSGGTAATLRPGTVNTVPATIKGVPLDGGSDNATPPKVEFPLPKVGKDGRGWICAEVTYLPDKLWAVGTFEIVQVADPDSATGDPLDGLPNATGGSLPLPGNRARHPLALLVKRDGGTLDVFQVSFFDLQTRTQFKADGVTPSRHFFWS